ncbi:MAG: 4Fe-4S binding protein [Myxococcales bacterium]|nr:4Fe-4S binding protein [Myxococcales bacterium]
MATKIVSQPKLRFWERLYFPRILQGLGITGRHVVQNLLHPKDMPTISYPDVQVVYPDAFRGMHRLTVKPSGEEKCTACMLCATACPADCIHIVAERHPDPSVEKHPLSYDINTLRCVYCGLCVEACPVDAIRMDTGKHPPPGRDRGQFWEDKALLMGRSEGFSVPEGGLAGARALEGKGS